jgi:hypothetical protein
MASQVKYVTSDITSGKQKNLLTNIVKHAFSNVINMDDFKNKLADKRASLQISDIVKMKSFKKELL